MTSSTRLLAPWIGLVVGGTAWAANMQAGQILPHVDCASGFGWTAPTSFAAGFVAAAAAVVSWRAPVGRSPAEDGPRTGGFVSRVSGLAGALFAFALLMQGVASLVLSACQR